MANPSSAIPTWKIKPDVIENVLGAGTYEAWLKRMDDFDEQRSLADTNENRYSDPSVTSLKEQLQKDLAVANQIADDYWAFLVRVSTGAYVTSGDGGNLVQLFDLAYILLSNDNDVLDTMNDLSIKVWLSFLVSIKLDQDAKALQKLLDKLTVELKKAKSRARMAWVVAAIDTALSVAAVISSGPLGLMIVGGGAITKVILHQYVEPSSSETAIRSRQEMTGPSIASAPLKLLDATSKVKRIAKVAGKGGGATMAVVGFYFDVKDIEDATDNVDDLKKAMDDAKEALDEMAAKITRNKASLSALARQLGQLDLIMGRKQDQKLIAKFREMLQDRMRRMGYPPNIIMGNASNNGTGFRMEDPEIAQ